MGSPRNLLLLASLTIVLAGGLIAAVFIGATSTTAPPATTSAAALATATRSLPPFWVVAPGDTYDSIAARNHLSVSQLGALNPRQDPTTLVPGQRLRLHVAVPGARRPRRALPAFWTVRRGDTYTSIAARTGLAVGDLAAFNPKANPVALVPGERLKLRP